MVILKFPVLYLLVAAGFVPGCAKDLNGNTSFKEANKGFKNELPAKKRKEAIKALQAETEADGARATDRTVTPLPPQVVTPVNPPPKP